MPINPSVGLVGTASAGRRGPLTVSGVGPLGGGTGAGPASATLVGPASAGSGALPIGAG